MTRSAPIERTISTFWVLQTPVTYAPNALAICTAKVPTPPEAPMINTSCSGVTRPWSRTACRAVKPVTGTAAACSKLRFSGFGAKLVLPSACVLGERSPADAEHLVAGPEGAHVFAERLHDPCHVRADDRVLWPAESVAREAYRVRQARHDVPDVTTHAGRMNAQKHLVVSDLGLV